MTANAMPGDREKCLAAGMDSYVSKPIELNDLRAVLMTVATPQVAAETDQALIDQRRIDQLLEIQDENNPTLLADIITLFLNDSPHHLKTISQAIAHQDAALLESSSHRFLSSIDNLGVQRMNQHCVALERLGKQGTLSGAQVHLDGLQQEFDLARAPLLQLASANPGPRPQMD